MATGHNTDNIIPENVIGLSDAEQYRMRRIYDLLDESRGHIADIRSEADNAVNNDIATAKALITSIDEGARASIENDLALALSEINKVNNNATNYINAHINSAIDSLASAGINPVLSATDRLYYDIHSPADAFNLTQLVNNETGKDVIVPVVVPPTSPPAVISPPPPLPVIGDGGYTVIGNPGGAIFNPGTTSPPIPIDDTGKCKYYIWLDDGKGNVVNIPFETECGRTPDPDWHTEPYVPPPPVPPVLSCAAALPSTNINGGTNQFHYFEDGGSKYIAFDYAGQSLIGGAIKKTVSINGQNCDLYLTPWPPPPPPPPPPPNTGDNAACVGKTVPPTAANGKVTLMYHATQDTNGNNIYIRDYVPTENVSSLVTAGWSLTAPVGGNLNIVNSGAVAGYCQYGDSFLNCFCGPAGGGTPIGPPPPLPPPPPPCPPGCIRLDEASNDPSYNKPCGDWDDPSKVCEAHTVTSNSPAPPAPPTQNTGNTELGYLDQLASVITSVAGDALTVIPSLFSSIFNFNGENMILDALKQIISAGSQSAVSASQAAYAACGISIGNGLQDIMQLSIAGWAERVSCAPVTYLFNDIKYDLQFNFPTILPQQAEIDNMYLANLITQEAWRCYTRANGNLPFTHQLNMETKRSRPDARQTVFLKRYGKITEEDYKVTMRSLGFIWDDDRNQFEQSLVNLPGVSDLTRFMVRDVEDKEIVDKYKLFDQKEFDKKYVGDVKKWAVSQGIPDDVFQKYWTAHWQYLSNTEVFQAIRRLRPGRRADGLQFTKSDAEYLLRANDFAPGQIDILLALSYEVPTRTDIKRGYNIDAIERKDVIEYLQDEGYTKDDSETIAKIFDKEKDLYKLQQNMRYSAFTVKQLSNMYAAGELPKDEVTRTMQTLGLKQEQIDKALATADTKGIALANRRCLASIKKRYMNGVLDANEVLFELQNLKLDAFKIQTLAKQWNCEFDAREKEPPASKAIEWYIRGIIGIGELHRRLVNLGYNEETTEAWITEAAQKQREAVQKQREKEIKEAQRMAKLQRQAVVDAEKLRILQLTQTCDQLKDLKSKPNGSSA